MNNQNLRNLSQEELSLLSSIGYEHLIPKEFKVIQAEVICDNCKQGTVQFIKMTKYSDGSWLRHGDLTFEESKEFPIEVCTIRRRYCASCYTPEDFIHTITPLYYQQIINKEYDCLRSMTTSNTMSKEAVFSIMKTAAQRAALCFGDIENWRNFLPKPLKGRIAE
jgi:hypothetical protein